MNHELSLFEEEPRAKHNDKLRKLIELMTLPIITFRSPWPKEELPQKPLGDIQMERLIQQMNELRKNRADNPYDELLMSTEYATPSEMLIYLYTASLEAPLASEYVKIYCYITTQYFKRKGIEVPNDIKVEELDAWTKEEMFRLARWIRNQQWKATRRGKC